MVRKPCARIESVDPFLTHSGKIAVVPGDNLDTDRIIPARFLTHVSRFGYGGWLFNDVRGAEFALDQPEAQGASVMIVGSNFGCGSSREHAVWALQQAGYRAVIAKKSDASPGYSDIFRQNAANCGLLLIELLQTDHEKFVAAGSGAQVTIDLPAQQIHLGSESIAFEINATNKEAIVNGWDLIGTTLVYGEKIDAYESQDLNFVPGRA